MADESQQPAVEVPLVYASALRIGVLFTDIRLYFGENVPPPAPAGLESGQAVEVPGGKQIDRLCIVVTPDIIPAMVEGLQKAVEFYQAKFGLLRTTPNKLAQQRAKEQQQ
jgi:hypothetical protein